MSIILAGVLFSLYWQWQIPENVYFSGDAGLKALLAKQWAAGIFRFDLVSSAPEWVEQLWQRGLYPYQEPFVYAIGDRHYITFPFTFPLITAPFYALFGDRGLYFIPLISTWIIWLNFYWLCQRLRFDSWAASLGLIILIFASPLTIYTAMYWEHTLAVALGFASISILVNALISSNLSARNASASGFLLGFSVWVRPEFFSLVGIAIAWIALSFLPLPNSPKFYSLFSSRTNKVFFLVSILATVCLFFLCNQLIYHHPLGIHAIQIVENTSLSDRLRDAWQNFKQLSITFMIYFPITGFVLVYICSYFSFIKAPQKKIFLILIYEICPLFILGVSLLVPAGTAGLIPGGKQWGTRFLLALVPIISLIVVRQFIYLRKTRNHIIKYSSYFIFVLLLLFSIHKNTYQATLYLKKSYQGILPAIELLESKSDRIIAVSHQFVAQALQASLKGDKIFVRVENPEQLNQLAITLKSQDRDKFIYICYPYRPCQLPETKPEHRQFHQGDRAQTVKFTKLGKFGNYPIYEARIAH